MSFNTRPSTINEINSWVSGRLTNVLDEMKRTPKGTPEYEYLEGRVEYLQKFIDARNSLIGKKLPESKRNAWLKKLDKL
jgi:hypothetical protein